MALDRPSGPGPERTGARRDDPAHLVGAERLPCGRPLAEVWEEARPPAGPAGRHTASCPHCRQAVAGLAALDAATARLPREPSDARSVAERVMRAVRAEVRLGRPLPLDDPSGRLRIAEYTAAKVLRRAADGVPGVRAVGCRPTVLDDGSVAVAMTLAAGLDAPLPGRMSAVRRAVSGAADRELGLRPGPVDLRVVAVLPEPAPAGPPAPGGRP